MNVIYSFIGKLPNYIIETIYQLRLYYDGDVYLIIDDIKSQYLKDIVKFNIKIIFSIPKFYLNFVDIFVKYIRTKIPPEQIKEKE